jgi:hypothetical protein
MKAPTAESVSVIGSFKQKYNEVLDDWSTFTDAGLIIRSPKGAPVIEPGIDFVRFESDDPAFTDAQTQQIALHRILGSDFVYTVAPKGYVGRTTCFEIGRIVQANVPIYFSEQPQDLPIEIPDDHVVSAVELVERFKSEMPQPLLHSLGGVSLELETNLVAGNYQNL